MYAFLQTDSAVCDIGVNNSKSVPIAFDAKLLKPYEYDEVSRGAREYWKYPAETFWDGEGDCEDSSILYVTLMKAMGYDTALIVYVDHAMASIHFANNSDNYGDQVVTINGKRYVLVETTGTGISWTDRDGYQLGDVFDSDYAVSKIRKTFVAGASA